MNVLLGMGLPFIIFLLLIWILHRGKKSSPVVYDEMQTAVRGIAYKYSTITGVIGGFIASFLVNLDLIPMDGSFALVAVSFLMVTVYVVYMIVKGVYFGVSGNWKSWTLLIFLIGLCNLITGTIRVAENGLEENKLTITNIGIMMGSMFLIITATVIIQKAREKKDENQ